MGVWEPLLTSGEPNDLLLFKLALDSVAKFLIGGLYILYVKPNTNKQKYLMRLTKVISELSIFQSSLGKFAISEIYEAIQFVYPLLY